MSTVTNNNTDGDYRVGSKEQAEDVEVQFNFI